ncbi:MAG: hypothetical protein WBX22_08695 [Silvibacterium sp.]
MRVAFPSWRSHASGLSFGVVQLDRLPRAGTKKVQGNVQGRRISAVDDSEEPWLAGSPCLGDHLARFASDKNRGLVPNGGDGGQHIARRIFDIALQIAAKAEERRRQKRLSGG